MLIGTTLGATLGLLTPNLGGKWDLVTQRIVDSLMAFPTLVLALVIVASLGASVMNALIAIAVVQVPWGVRVIRSTVLSVREMQFVEAARGIGCSGFRLIFVHILPSCVPPYVILATVTVGNAIVTEASLSFLGLGTQPPSPSWGYMLAGAGRRYAAAAPWLGIFPGVALALVVLGFNLLGDTVRDLLDPRTRPQ
ncbi:MAG: ABC transporter permease [Chloroflexi bacterium]|nr:ABC transporter permease [Chloroflexota bacterium]